MSREKEVKNELWSAFRSGCGDWKTALIPALARERSGLRLREIGKRAGGMDEMAVSARIIRFKKSMRSNAQRRKTVHTCMAKCRI